MKPNRETYRIGVLVILLAALITFNVVMCTAFADDVTYTSSTNIDGYTTTVKVQK